MTKTFCPPANSVGWAKDGSEVALAAYSGWRVKRSRRHLQVSDAVIVTLGGPQGQTANLRVEANIYLAATGRESKKGNAP
jgi:hypothetical protein